MGHCTFMAEPEQAPVPWFGPGPTLVIMANWGVNQWMESLSHTHTHSTPPFKWIKIILNIIMQLAIGLFFSYKLTVWSDGLNTDRKNRIYLKCFETFFFLFLFPLPKGTRQWNCWAWPQVLLSEALASVSYCNYVAFFSIFSLGICL